MLHNLLEEFRNFTAMREFARLEQGLRDIVVYSEGPASWVHLRPIVTALLHEHGQPLAYVTSDKFDPGLELNDERIHHFVIGTGAARTSLFRTIPSKIIVMTTPDLQNLSIKRSFFPAHYVYVHHSLVSSHMIYRPGAFDHFDTIFCAGPHHVRETRAAEECYGLPAKNLVEHGYGRLDEILATREESGASQRSRLGCPPRILVAPSWGPNGILETVGVEVTQALLDAGYQVTVRPHPQTWKYARRQVEQLRDRFGSHGNFTLNSDVTEMNDLLRSDLLVSDWSGIALEFAFGLERPVLFIDVPRKINNPNYADLPTPPLEVSIRDKIGSRVDLSDLSSLSTVIDKMLTNETRYRKQLARQRALSVFNVGRSGTVGARELVRLLAAAKG